MPYRRRVYRRKPAPARRGTVVRKVARSEVKRALKKEIEVKYTDSQPASAFQTCDRLATTSQDFVYPGARGLTGETFVGQKVRPVGVYLRYLFQVKGGTASLANQVRIIIIQGKQSTFPSATQLLLNTANDSNSILSQFNRDYNQTYKLLYDKVLCLTPGDNTNCRHLTIFIPAKKLSPITYSSAGTAEKGVVCAYVFGNTNVAGSEPTYMMSGRMYYTDA